MAEIFLAILKVIDIEKVFINKDIEKKKNLVEMAEEKTYTKRREQKKNLKKWE